MRQIDAEFFIHSCNKADCLERIKKMEPNKNEMSDGFAFILPEHYKNADTLEQALQGWRWNPKTDEGTKHITGINFGSNYFGDEIELFIAIAPFVKVGSFIEMEGENDERWRWFFIGTTCIVKQGKQVWQWE